MTFFNIIIWREEYSYWLHNELYTRRIFNHESIHVAQMKDLFPWIPIGGIIFYLLYLIEWLIKVLFVYPFSSKAYKNISFEREAYQHEADYDYLSSRKKFNWLKRIFK